MRYGRGAVPVILLGAGVVFLGIEAVEAVLAVDALPGPLRFAALHTVGVVAFGILSVLCVIAAVFFSRRWFVVLIGACVAAAALALLLV